MAALGVALASFALNGSVLAAASHPGRMTTESTFAQPETTSSLPSAKQLLSNAAGSSEAQRSVLEYGTIHSANNGIYDGETFWSNFSWASQVFHDREMYRRPQDLIPLKHIRDIRRVVVGPWLAVRAHHRWYCAPRAASASVNSSYWASPRFALQNPRTIGPEVIDRHDVWNVQGQYTGKASGGSVSHLTVDVFIDRGDYLFRGVQESGTVTIAGRGTVSITGTEQYGEYGKAVKVSVPLACKS